MSVGHIDICSVRGLNSGDINRLMINEEHIFVNDTMSIKIFLFQLISEIFATECIKARTFNYIKWGLYSLMDSILTISGK